VTDNSAFKNQVRARMAETGEKYTVAHRMVIAGHDPGQPPVILRVYLNPYVDLKLTAQAGREYAGAGQRRQRDMSDRLLADQIEVAGFEEAKIAASAEIVTDQELKAEDDSAEDAAIRGAFQRWWAWRARCWWRRRQSGQCSRWARSRRGGGMTVSRSSRSSSGTVTGISPASRSEPASCWRWAATATAR
jgi:hypothetical protein